MGRRACPPAGQRSTLSRCLAEYSMFAHIFCDTFALLLSHENEETSVAPPHASKSRVGLRTAGKAERVRGAAQLQTKLYSTSDLCYTTYLHYLPSS